MPGSPLQSWTFIVFGLNEAATLARVVEGCLHLQQQWGMPETEVIIVDDGSTDDTPAVAKALAQRHPQVRVVTHPQNRGIGQSLRSGYAQARNENVVAVPADGQFDLQELLPFPSVPQRQFISFARRQNEQYNWFRRLLTRTNKAINRIGAGIRLTDVNWIKVYKREALQSLSLKMKTPLVESEICGKLLALGHQVQEVDSQYLPRQAGATHVTRFALLWSSLMESLRMVREVRRFRRGMGK